MNRGAPKPEGPGIMKSLQNQRGLSLLGFIFILVLVLFFTYIGIKLVPIYLNHMSVMSEVKAVASQPGSANKPPNTIRRELLRRMSVSYIDHVEPQHITIERADQVRIVVKYDVQQHLIGNIDAIVRFNSAEPLRN
ncbi:DUF4845 domain-containing protein [Wenzhouxiangella sediminis]|uniref:DUF4845 domain-containing protein n=2 Tax=Wenzhouxiangella sediminis TaxID=1792836 RepID=A0A3E1K9M6_9GAMM|nr:DUF4845 domain-containing protein [Wenzhouxiangella sediminis]